MVWMPHEIHENKCLMKTNTSIVKQLLNVNITPLDID